MWFGNGRIAELAAACAELGIQKPLLVTDEGLAELDIVQRARNILETAGIVHHFYSDVRGNPTGANIEHGIQVYREALCDGVIAFGGGSALDAGKTIAFLAGQSRSLWEFEDIGDNWTRADATAIAPVIAIPTTAAAAVAYICGLPKTLSSRIGAIVPLYSILKLVPMGTSPPRSFLPTLRL